MKVFRSFLMISAWLVASASTAERPAVVSSEVTVVQIDAVVIDADGRVVSGLDKQDFELHENGRPQPILHFEVATVARPVDLRVPRETAPAESMPSGTPAPRGRDVVLLVDDFHIGAVGLPKAKDALRRLIDERLAPQDRVALATTSGQLAVYSRLTTDRESLRRGIERLAPRSRRSSPLDLPLTPYQAERIVAGDTQAERLAVADYVANRAGFGQDQAAVEVGQRARTMVAESAAMAAAALTTIENTVRLLAPLPGRKVLVMVSEGFLAGLETRESKQFDMKRITDAATRAGVVLYALDVRGLMAPGEGDLFAPVISSMPGIRERFTAEAEKAQLDAMDALASETGGFTITRTNNLEGALGKILDDSSLYYVLGYEPMEPHDGSFRRVEVRIPRHPGLRIRARKGFYAPGGKERPKEKKEEPVRAALTSVLPLAQIPVRLSADYAGVDAGASQIALNAWIDVAALPLAKVADRHQSALEVLSAVFDEDGKGVLSAQEKMDLALDEAKLQSVRKTGLAFQKPLSVKKAGAYLVRLAIHDPKSGYVGNASQWVQVPDPKAPLALSGIFLSASTAGGETFRSIQAVRRAAAGDALLFQYYVYRPRDAKGSLTLEVYVDSGGRRAISLPPAPLTVEEKDGVLLPQAGRISLAGFPPGEYEMGIAVTESPSRARASGKAAFRVD